MSFCSLSVILWLLVTGYWFLAACQAAPLRIHFLDVGEGDSILIQTPKGKTVLVDAGNCITGVDVADYLKKNNIRQIDKLIFTHYDLDHIGGAFFILPQIGAGEVYDNGYDLTSSGTADDIYRWYEELVRKRNNYGVLKAEDKFVLDGVIFEVLWPCRPFAFSDFNSNSLVIMVKYKSFKCLLVGDLTVAGERELLSQAQDLGADILKVGHHGSSDASSEDFLAVVSPEISIISVNKDNIRGYPAQEVLERLESIGSTIYRTDKGGTLIIEVGADGKFTLETEGL